MKRRGEDRGAQTWLRVDAAACDGIGLCAHLTPSAVELDRWGFPVIVGRELDRGEVSAARRAVRACPRKALWLETTPAPAPAPTHAWPPMVAPPVS